MPVKKVLKTFAISWLSVIRALFTSTQLGAQVVLHLYFNHSFIKFNNICQFDQLSFVFFIYFTYREKPSPCDHGRRQEEQGGLSPLWIFIHGTDIVDKGLILLFFRPFFRCLSPPWKRFNSAIFRSFFCYPLPPWKFFLPTPLPVMIPYV